MARPRPRNSTERLKTKADILKYLNAAFETGEAGEIAHALGVAARAKGMAKIAKKTGLGRESLYKALSKDGNPRLDTLLKVVHALGLKLKLAA